MKEPAGFLIYILLSELSIVFNRNKSLNIISEIIVLQIIMYKISPWNAERIFNITNVTQVTNRVKLNTPAKR